MSDGLEETAAGISERGLDALLARLRPAFREAASAHADALVLDEDQLEEMVQRAADTADGLQWRRALAAVASEQLGIGLGEALSHPAVVRAHAILGVPSYEESLAELEDLPAPSERPSVSAVSAEEAAEPQESSEETAESPVVAAAAAERDDDDWEQAGEEPLPDPIERHDDTVRLRGVHLGGIADLASPEPGVELWFSDEGLDIIRATKEPLGRLSWEELRALEVPPARGRFGRRQTSRAFLVIRGDHGDASFEIPGVSPDELREHLAPMLDDPM